MKRQTLAAIMMVVLIGLSLGFMAEECHAGGGDYMERTGIEGLFAGRDDAEGRGPNRWQMALGIAAFPVMIAVVKWL